MFVVNVINRCQSLSVRPPVRIVYRDRSYYRTSTQAANCPDNKLLFHPIPILFLITEIHFYSSICCANMPDKCKNCRSDFSSSEFFAKCTGCSLCYHASCTRFGSNQNLSKNKLKSFEYDSCNSDYVSIAITEGTNILLLKTQGLSWTQ